MPDYTKLCRICLRPESEKTGTMLPISQTRIHLDTIGLLQAMALFTDTEMITDERFPQIICSTCTQDLTNGYVFKLKCEQSDIFLRKEILKIDNPIGLKRKNVATSTEEDLLDEENSAAIMSIMNVQENTNGRKRATRSGQTKRINNNQNSEATDTPENMAIASCSQNGVNAIIPNDLQYQVISDPITGETLFNIEVGSFTKSTDIKSTVSEGASFSQNYLYTNAQGIPYSNLKIEDVEISSISKLDYDLTSYEVIASEFEVVKEETSLCHVAEDDNDLITSNDLKIENVDQPKQNARPSRRRQITRTHDTIKKRKPRKCSPKVVSTTLTCCSCPESYERLLDLKKHFVAKHTRGQICLVCRKSFARMRFHTKVHFKPGNIFKCKKCPEAFNSEFVLAKHYTESHPSWMCQVCDLDLENAADFKEHLIGHEKRPAQSAAATTSDFYSKRLCDICNELCDSTIKLRAHFEECHVTENYCKVCEEEIPKSILFKHIRDHTRYRRYRCDICKKFMISEESFKVHNAIHHDGYEVCQYCLQELNSREEFNNHRLQHEINGTMGRYRCRVCFRELANISALIVHMGVHDKIIKCHACFHWFNIEKHYQRHLALDHKVKCTATCRLCRLVEDNTDP